MSKNLGSDETDFKQHLHFSEHWVVFFFYSSDMESKNYLSK